jgi:hypothetical protein
MAIGYTTIVLKNKGEVPTIKRFKEYFPTDMQYDGEVGVNIPDVKAWLKIGDKPVQILMTAEDIAALIHAAPSATLNLLDEVPIWDYITKKLGKLNGAQIIALLNTLYAPIGGGDIQKSKEIKYTDINGGVSPVTDCYINLDPLTPGQYISDVFVNVLTNFLASDASTDVQFDIYDSTNSLSLIGTIGAVIDIYTEANNMAKYNNVIKYPRNLANTINLQLHFYAADLTKLIAGDLKIFYIIKTF